MQQDSFENRVIEKVKSFTAWDEWSFATFMGFPIVVSLIGLAAWATYHWFLSGNLWAMAGAALGYSLLLGLIVHPFDPVRKHREKAKCQMK